MSDPLPLDDWGGTGPVLHLAHANGFPPGSYRKLIEQLKPRYHVFTLRSRGLVPGTDPRVMRDWEDMADDLAQALRARGLEGVVGVGHSMGGVATLLASVKYPGLFRAVVALDPVLFTGTLPGARAGEVPGTHLFPLEHPEECGRRLLTFLEEAAPRRA